MAKRTARIIGMGCLATCAALAAHAGDSNDDVLLEMPLEELLNVPIATGTRETGVMAWQSAAPITVLSAHQLALTGQDNLFDALMALTPSMSWTFNYDLGNIVRSARLRGMSPGEVLVLINGKRRHPTARINADPGTPDQGSNPVDLELIPLSLIDHVEILLDGASAQYGTDAVSGVINVILVAPDGSADSVVASTALTGRGDGARHRVAMTKGYVFGGGGRLSLGIEARKQEFANRTANLFGTDVPNHVLDYPESNVLMAGGSFEQPLSNAMSLYAFSTLAIRDAENMQNTRVTSRFTPGLATLAPGRITSGAVSVYPTQFIPRETLSETDGAITTGIRGRRDEWDWDLSFTAGHDSQEAGVRDTVNVGMLAATGSSPTSAKIGTESVNQYSVNLDLRRQMQLFMPATLAAGLDVRRETYSEGAGDPASYLYGAMQGFGGRTPTDASSASRHVVASYVDLTLRPQPDWIVNGAARYEQYSESDVGNTLNGKLATRYALTPQWALRATLGTGFHAPTLAQSHFSATLVGQPSGGAGASYAVQLPVDSPGGELLGAPPLRPEKSTNLSIGLVANPLPDLSLSMDLYRIGLRDRIIDTGFIPGPGAPPAATALVQAALSANGNIVTGTSPVQVQFFTNGVDTRTEGIDLAASYLQKLSSGGKIRWSVDANFNRTKVTNIQTPPSQLAAAGITYINAVTLNELTEATPNSRILFMANYRQGPWEVTPRITRYGGTSDISPYAATPFTKVQIDPTWIADIDVAYYLPKNWRLSAGATNLFDKLPPRPPLAAMSPREPYRYPFNTPWSNYGAFYYLRLATTF